MPKPKPKRKPRGPNYLSAAAVKALGPLQLEAELAPEDWTNLEAAGEDGQPRIPTFKMRAYNGGVMRPRTSFDMYGEGIVVDLATAKQVPGQLPIHYVHDTRDPVGHAEDFNNDGRSITIAGKLSVPGTSNDKITGGAKNGFRWRPSISARGFKLERLLENQTAAVNGRTVRGPILIARNAEIYETSFLSVAGDPTASATVSASNFQDSQLPTQESNPMTFAQFLAAAGITEANQTQDQLTVLRAAFDAQYGDDEGEEGGEGSGVTAPKPKPKTPILNAAGTDGGNTEDGTNYLQQHRQQLALDTVRCNEINRLCAGGSYKIKVNGQDVDLQAHAIETGMSANDVELHILRAGRPTGPAIHSRSSDDTQNLDAMTAALFLSAGLALDSPVFTSDQAYAAQVPAFLRRGINDDRRQQIMEAGHRYGSVNLLEFARDAVELETGQRIRNRNDLIQAAASSGNLTRLYSHSVGAALLVGYQEATATSAQWTGVEYLPDFKSVERFRDDAEESLELILPNQEAAHATAGTKFEFLKVDMYGKQYVVGRHSYMNNDLGVLAKKPRKMGATARRLEEDFIIATLLSNPTMNSTGRQLFNTTDGTLHGSHALSSANGSKAISYMMKRTDGEQTLELKVGYALVPTDLYDLAVQIFRSPTKTSSDGDKNALYEHNVMPVGSARLSNGVKHPKTKAFATGSTTSWYTIAKDEEVAMRCYLQDTAGVPQVRVTQLTQGQWGQHIDVCHDYGFGFVSTKGADKFTA